MTRRKTPLGAIEDGELLRLRHDWDPAPETDAGRFIVRARSDGEPGVVVILADSDTDYVEYHLAPWEIELTVKALARRLSDGTA